MFNHARIKLIAVQSQDKSFLQHSREMMASGGCCGSVVSLRQRYSGSSGRYTRSHQAILQVGTGVAGLHLGAVHIFGDSTKGGTILKDLNQELLLKTNLKY